MNATSATVSGASCSDATSTPIAMARSRAAPPLRNAEGARLTVTRCMGHVRPQDMIAARTRSRASRHTESGEPTTVNPGRPEATWTSTETWWPSTPSRDADGTVASMGAPRCDDGGTEDNRTSGWRERAAHAPVEDPAAAAGSIRGGGPSGRTAAPREEGRRGRGRAGGGRDRRTRTRPANACEPYRGGATAERVDPAPTGAGTERGRPALGPEFGRGTRDVAPSRHARAARGRDRAVDARRHPARAHLRADRHRRIAPLRRRRRGARRDGHLGPPGRQVPDHRVVPRRAASRTPSW